MLFDQLEARPLSLQTTMNIIKYINDDIRELRYVKALENEYLQNAKLIVCTNKEIQSANEINSSKILQVDEFAFDSITRFCGGLGCIDWHLMLGLDPSHFPAKLIERQKESMKRDGNPIYHPVLELMQEKPIQASQDSSFLARSTAEAVYVSNQIFSKEGGYSRGLSANDQASWRKAEVFAIDILSSLGIDAKDVSKRNCGCDLIGLENGSEREIYVEVKLIESIGAEFRVTDNEIFAAKEKGDNYWLLLIVQPDKNQPPTHVAVTKNAYEMIADNVDRRCIKYEAFCSEYKAKFSQIVFG